MTSGIQTWHNQGAMGTRKVDYAMSEQEHEKDTMGRDLPAIGEVYERWLTIDQAMEQTRFTSKQGLRDAVIAGRIAGYKLGTERRGEWRVDPSTLGDYRNDLI